MPYEQGRLLSTIADGDDPALTVATYWERSKHLESWHISGDKL